MALTHTTEERSGVPEWTLGERLEKAMNKAGLSREDMAREFQVSVPAIGHWLKDRNKPSDLLDTIHKWAELTDVPVEWLLGITSRYLDDPSYLHEYAAA